RLARGGRACLVQPLSLLGSRDAAAIRSHLTRTARLRGLWVANAPVFDAAVEVCAPIFERTERTERSERSDRTHVKLFGGRTVTPSRERREPREATDARDGSWSALALPALGVPTPRYRSDGRLGDLVRAVAGFRDEYYGLIDHVIEAPTEHDPTDLAWPDEHAPLITVGL